MISIMSICNSVIYSSKNHHMSLSFL
uniref:Uncharacterized protein n=1 Tax=Arundo donax TaxID=35708 RepID=A0A0A9FDS5_ARUDO